MTATFFSDKYYQIDSQADVFILKKGAMKKKGSGFANGWGKRWFILRQNGILSYYTDKDYLKKRDELDLIPATNLVLNDDKRTITIDLNDPKKKTLQLWCYNDEDAKKWYASLNRFFGDNSNMDGDQIKKAFTILIITNMKLKLKD
eukprot:CAMPEP_0114660126 /NCGR_PEP_ID=MMETSP0191-20121206/19354_1 /TAXON_ID=126664 /ORGANISM="Sorites sp." /LENGTH=145 /DNA_ID=CAMNT_0001887673 /DNA_START=34 /DNA_END=471 /DNA_ORIENTATION=-